MNISGIISIVILLACPLLGAMAFFIKHAKRQIKATETPIQKVRKKIIHWIQELPEEALQRRVTITGINGKGNHTLGEIKKMPRLLEFFALNDLQREFPGVLKKRTGSKKFPGEERRGKLPDPLSAT